MNKQILDKLRTETDIWCDENFPDHPLYDAKWEEKFAELIVQECANYIIEYYPHSRYEAMFMKKHFGVE